MKRDRLKKTKKNIAVSLIFPFVTFVVIFGLFYYGITQISSANNRQELESLQTTIHRDIVHCYASEGVYPPNLEYIEDNYGLTYDHNKYYIEYQPVGVNVLPDVTVMEVSK